MSSASSSSSTSPTSPSSIPTASSSTSTSSPSPFSDSSPSSSSSSIPSTTSTSTSELKDPLYTLFIAYSSYGQKDSAGHLDSNMFSKMCREVGIVNKTCSKTDVDLIFMKCKGKGGRKLDWRMFKEALQLLAEKRFPKTHKEEGAAESYKKIEELCHKSDGPQSSKSTKTEFVKFHDDKSSYTGVYKTGSGPTNVDSKITLSSLMDRSPSDARGRKM